MGVQDSFLVEILFAKHVARHLRKRSFHIRRIIAL